ncbi:helix-turn-helix domain-containing protein [Parasalinivibrio latis]|uniref:helix-turn-helix domain-containing protein n=1 Tax=Parasalinivibrio latis TaxID=2952610 RepID=UPI0030E0EDE9
MQEPNAEPSNVPYQRAILLEHHKPEIWDSVYHHHASIEINFLKDCDMTYSFSEHNAQLQGGFLTLFWGTYPHRVIDVKGEGTITNIYVTLSQFLQWSLPQPFINAVLSGAVITAKEQRIDDYYLTKRWAQELCEQDSEWDRLHALELEARLYRLAVEGWNELIPSRQKDDLKVVGGKAILHFERMLRYMSQNFPNPISIQDIAESSGVSVSYAVMLFRKFLGRTMKEHLTELRLQHAKMLLTESNAKIVSVAIESGFSSISCFYDTFQKHVNTSPAEFRKISNQRKVLVD